MSLSLSGSWLSHCSDCYRRREKNRNDTKYTASAYTRRKLEFKIKCKLPSGIFCPGYWLDNKGSTLTCDFNNPAPYPSLHPIPAGCERDRCMEVKLEELSGYKRTRVNKFIKTEKGDWQPESKIELKCSVWCLRGEESETAELAVWVRFCHGCSFFFWGGGGTESEWLSLAASDNSMISFCLHLRYSPRVWIIFTTRHWYNLYQRIPCFQRTKRLHIFTMPHHSATASHATTRRY